MHSPAPSPPMAYPIRCKPPLHPPPPAAPTALYPSPFITRLPPPLWQQTLTLAQYNVDTESHLQKPAKMGPKAPSPLVQHHPPRSHRPEKAPLLTNPLLPTCHVAIQHGRAVKNPYKLGVILQDNSCLCGIQHEDEGEMTEVGFLQTWSLDSTAAQRSSSSSTAACVARQNKKKSGCCRRGNNYQLPGGGL